MIDQDEDVVVPTTTSHQSSNDVRGVFRDLNGDETHLGVTPPTEIIRSNSITSNSTFETTMFLDAQSQEDELLKVNLRTLETEFEEQADRLLATETTVRELRDQLLQVQGERDSVLELCGELRGQVQSLQQQCESVVGLDMSLKVAIAEIDRLRKVKLTENEIEREKQHDEARLKVQSLNLEMDQLRSHLVTEQREKERIRQEMEEELARMMQKLSEETREEFEKKLFEATEEISRLRRCIDEQGSSQEGEIIAKEIVCQLRGELFQLQFELNEVRESLDGTRMENIRISEEAKAKIDFLEAEIRKMTDDRNQLEMNLSLSVEERNRLRFSIKEDGKVPREEVSKAVAHAVESRDQQIKDLRQQVTQISSLAKKANDEKNWLSARLQVSKEETALLQQKITEQQIASDRELRLAQLEKSNTQAESDRLHAKLNAIYSENQRMESELDALNRKVEILRQQKTQKETLMSKLEVQLKDVELKLLSSDAAMNLIRTQLDAANEALAFQNKKLREVQQGNEIKAIDELVENEAVSNSDSQDRNAFNVAEERLDKQILSTSKNFLQLENTNISKTSQDTEWAEHYKETPNATPDENTESSETDIGASAQSTCVTGGTATRETQAETEVAPTVAFVIEEDSLPDAGSVDTPKARGGIGSKTLDSFEEHVHIWPRTWHDNDRRKAYGGRDVVGYGTTPPRPMWPNMASVALNFVIHYEEGSELCLLHGDSSSEAQLTEILGAQPIEGQRAMNIESMYDYGSRAGFWRLHRLFTSKQIPCTVFAAGMALERNPLACRAMKEAGWEVASHGYRLQDYRNVDEETQTAHLKRTIAIHKKLLGDPPAGIFLGSPSTKTRSIVARHFYYDSDSYSDELPYWTMENNMPHLVIPSTLTLNDIRFVTSNGFSTGQEFSEHLIETLTTLLAEGRAGKPKMMTVGLHCRIIGRPGRAAGLSQFMDYVKGVGSDVWVCTREDIARYWYDKYYPKGQGTPISPQKVR